MKRLFAVILMVVLVFTISACGVRKALISELNELNESISGSISEGSIKIQTEEGSMEIDTTGGSIEIHGTDGENSSMIFSGDWPDNEFTRLLPKPKIALSASVTTDDEFSVLFLEAELGQLRDYVSQLKSAGFNIDDETVEEEMMGIEVFSYEAYNSAGYKVELYSSFGISGLTLSK